MTSSVASPMRALPSGESISVPRARDTWSCSTLRPSRIAVKTTARVCASDCAGTSARYCSVSATIWSKTASAAGDPSTSARARYRITGGADR